MSENLFRIGAFYRQRNGVVAEVTRGDGYCLFVETVWYPEGKALHGGGGRNAETGKYSCWSSAADDEYTLIPGELHQINGAWVPIEDPELVALQTRPQHVEASCEEEKPWLTEQQLNAAIEEPKRPPLPGYGQRTPFDPFADFIVHHREEVSVNAKPFAGLSLDGCEQFRAPRSI